MALQLTKKEPVNTQHRWAKFDDDTKVLLAGIDNTEYQVALERERRRIQRNDARFTEGQVGVVEGEKTEHESHAMLLGQFIIKGWEGVLDADGNTLKYDPIVAAELISTNVQFFLFVLREAALTSSQAAEERAETVGKQSPASSGKPTGAGRQKRGARSTSA
jgi:hypothetical protein